MAYVTMRYHWSNAMRSDRIVLWAACVLVFGYRATFETFRREFGDYMSSVDKWGISPFETTATYRRMMQDHHFPF